MRVSDEELKRYTPRRLDDWSSDVDRAMYELSIHRRVESAVREWIANGADPPDWVVDELYDLTALDEETRNAPE